MSSVTFSQARRAIRHIRRIWGELDYAQRRLLEIRTGVPVIERGQRPPAHAQIDELESLYARQ